MSKKSLKYETEGADKTQRTAGQLTWIVHSTCCVDASVISRQEEEASASSDAVQGTYSGGGHSTRYIPHHCRCYLAAHVPRTAIARGCSRRRLRGHACMHVQVVSGLNLLAALGRSVEHHIYPGEVIPKDGRFQLDGSIENISICELLPSIWTCMHAEHSGRMECRVESATCTKKERAQTEKRPQVTMRSWIHGSIDLSVPSVFIWLQICPNMDVTVTKKCLNTCNISNKYYDTEELSMWTTVAALTPLIISIARDVKVSEKKEAARNDELRGSTCAHVDTE